MNLEYIWSAEQRLEIYPEQEVSVELSEDTDGIGPKGHRMLHTCFGSQVASFLMCPGDTWALDRRNELTQEHPSGVCRR